MRSGLEQEAGEVSFAEEVEGGGEAKSAALVGEEADLRAGGFEGRDLGCGCMCAAEDQEVGVGGADQVGAERRFEMGVEDDAQERSTTWQQVGVEQAGAICERGVIGKDGADAGEDAVGAVAEELNFVTRGWAGEPEGLFGGAVCGRWGEFAVGRERGFEGDERTSMLNEMGEGVVLPARLILLDAEVDFDAGVAKFLHASAADERVGVEGGDHGAGYAGGDERVGAGRCAAVVRAGFEGDVGGGALGADAASCRLFEGDDLGVIALLVEVRTFADDEIFAGEDAADLRVGTGERGGLGGEVEGSAHPVCVSIFVWCGCHGRGCLDVALTVILCAQMDRREV